MKLSALPFSVDIFPPHANRTANPLAYFLTHAHRDHLQNLSATTAHRIYTTYQTALLASHRTQCPVATFFPLPYKTRIPITSFHVTLLPATHCPGACMFLFEGSFGSILHTGDFRADRDVLRTVQHLPVLDLLVLDVTYCHPDFNFPALDDASADIVERVVRARRDCYNVFIGTDLLGKEELLLSISIATKEKVVLEKDRFYQMQLIYPDVTHSHFTTQVNGPAVHVIPHWRLDSHPRIVSLKAMNKNMLRILPSAHHKSHDDVLHVPYSSHSSFKELYDFVCMVRPRAVQPTEQTASLAIFDGRDRDCVLWFSNLLREPAAGQQAGRTVGCLRNIVEACEVRNAIIGENMMTATGVGFGTMKEREEVRVAAGREGDRHDLDDGILYFGLVDADGRDVADEHGWKLRVASSVWY